MLMRPGESSGLDRMMNEDAMRKSAFRLSKTTLVGPGFGTFRTVSVRNTQAKRPAIVNCEHTLPSANAQSIVMSGAKPAAVSEVSFGVDVERGLHPATGREYAPNRPAIKGNPGPFGLLCFGMTTCMLMFVTTSWSPAGFIPVVMGYAMFFGGAGQLIAGILELIKGNTFAGTAFSSYGCFWMGWFLFNFFAVDKITPSVTAVAMTGDTLWCGLWGVLTFLFYIVTLRKNGCLQTIFLSLWITFFLLAGGNYSDKCKEAAGYVGFFCGSSAIYAAIAMLYQDELGWTLPGMRPTNFI
ncbi:GPR1/FUN34/yaaH family-domain-containing protein [Haematococcus lacustris]